MMPEALKLVASLNIPAMFVTIETFQHDTLY